MSIHSGTAEPGAHTAPLLPEDALKTLRQGIAQLGIPGTESLFRGRLPLADAESLAEKCAAYLREISLFNRGFGLVGTETDTEAGLTESAVRHILDSLAPWKQLAETLCERFPARDFSARRPRIADAGSGAGLPGIPLALLFPGADFILIERMEKRCVFLQNCKAVLGRQNLSVVNREIEQAKDTNADAVVFRAFRPLEKKILRALLRLLAHGETQPGQPAPPDSGNGASPFLAAYKGKACAIDEETKKIRESGFAGQIARERIAVPFLNEERHIVFLSEASKAE